MGTTFVVEYPSRISFPHLQYSEEDFFALCAANPDLPLERDRHGNILIMPPVGIEGSRREIDILTEVSLWNRRTGLGYAFSSQGAVTLPTGSVRSPDATWISRDRYEALPLDDRERFAHIAPDFVAEIKSRTDKLEELQAKMGEYMEAGVQLGFLIDPYGKKAWVYRVDGFISEHSFDETLSGEDVMPGFELPLSLLI